VDIEKYRGQWGGTIQSSDGTTEEMWWSEPSHALKKGSWGKRLRFTLDTRQFFLLKFLQTGIARAFSSGVTEPKIVDFGCGAGGTTLNFSSMINVPMEGFDIFSTQIQIANQHAKNIGSSSTFRVLNPDGTFPLSAASVDVLFSADVLGHVPNIPQALKEWARILKPNGTVALFTEASYSPGDQSLMARLAREGMDMISGVPEHISLFPRDVLEAHFREAGFEVEVRYSANVLHWFFFPKDYLLLFRRLRRRSTFWYGMSLVWNKMIKIVPFYPIPLEMLRLGLTRVFGKSALGTSYFYQLRREAKLSP
jgi:ubiquinone/menaquinone biosynthesis C-methylase UbiE